MHSLRARLTLTNILVALVAVVVVAGLATLLIQRGFDTLADRQAQADADDLAERVAEFYDRRDSWRGVEIFLRRRFPLAEPGTLAQRRRVQLLDSDGDVLFDSSRTGISRNLSTSTMGITAPIIVNGQQVGSVFVSSARDDLTSAERDFLARVRLSVIIGSAAAGAVALVVGLISVRGLTKPLGQLTAAAHRLASGARHDPLVLPQDRELRDLATAFNTMAAELEHAEELRRQQVADIAHELRTPIAVLRLQLESLEDGIEQPTPQLLASLTEEVGLLARLVDDLRLLSLADAGQLSLKIEAVDLSETFGHLAASSSARARQQQVSLNVEPPTEGLLVHADAQRLAQVLGNLIENALRYTPAGGQVRLRAQAALPPAHPNQQTRQSGRLWRLSERLPAPPPQPAQHPTMVIIEVSDTGPGIAPADLERIFDRFWRTDRARARETGGSGLGLAIVRRLVELQGGRVWATSTVGQGTTFHISLPAVPHVRRPSAPPLPQSAAAPRP
ncbi:MAG: ATP-binding protein [Roseiflexaceae bacterium]